jgi:ATP synthase protein I
MSAPRPTEDDLRRRLDRLSQTLDQENKEQAAQNAPPDASSGNIALVLRFASEFVAGVLVGGLIGWGVDWAFGTSPIFLIGFLLIGFGAALTNMVRVAKAAQAKTPLGKDLPARELYDDED